MSHFPRPPLTLSSVLLCLFPIHMPPLPHCTPLPLKYSYLLLFLPTSHPFPALLPLPFSVILLPLNSFLTLYLPLHSPPNSIRRARGFVVVAKCLLKCLLRSLCLHQRCVYRCTREALQDDI